MNGLPSVRVPAWMDNAACLTSEANFFPEPNKNATAAKAVCRECPVSTACLKFAVENMIPAGIFGGLTGNERRRFRQGVELTACPACGRLFAGKGSLSVHRSRWCGPGKNHGTHSCYSTGCRCEPCTTAHATYGRARRTAAS